MAKVYEKIKQRRKELGITQTEFAYKLGLNSKTSVSLMENGKIDISRTRILQIAKILDMNPSELLGYSEENIGHIIPPIRVNIHGTIPAGVPLESIEEIIDWEEIPWEWGRGDKQYIGLKVRGDSMYPKYLNGDTVLILITPDCDSGDDCAVYVNGYDATLKQVIKNVDGSITLNPLNTNYLPQTYKNNGDIKILGKVVEIRRKV